MRPISLLSLMAFCTVATGSAGIVMSESLSVREDASIPITAGLEYVDCGGNGSSVRIKAIQVMPNPPRLGQKLSVTVIGTVRKTVENGAYAKVSGKFGSLKFSPQRLDFCKEVHHVNPTVQCPVKPGIYRFMKTVALPKKKPPAPFATGVINIRGYTVDNKDLLCLDVKYDFKRFPLT